MQLKNISQQFIFTNKCLLTNHACIHELTKTKPITVQNIFRRHALICVYLFTQKD